MKLEIIYIFGDSLHDTGNLKKLTNGKYPSQAYFDGRFSNGPVYCDYLDNAILEKYSQKICIKNYAVGGALTNSVNGYSPESTSLVSQIESENFVFKGDDLIIIGCGANNYGFFFDIHKFPFIHLNRLYNLANDIELCVKKAIDQGAENILLFNVPNMFMAPLKYKLSVFFRKLVMPIISKSLLTTNKKIQNFVNGFEKKGVTLELFDICKLFSEALNSPEKFGFECSKKYVIPGLGRYDTKIPNLKEHSEYLFWDYVHPTTQGHKMLARHIFKLLQDKFQPMFQ